jgi:hypothetical protein
MKSSRSIILLPLLWIGASPDLAAQSKTIANPKFEFGIDFVRFNRNWIYYSEQLQPTDGNLYSFDLIPSIFMKLPLKKQSLRFKYEFFKKPYSFETSSPDSYQRIDGDLIEHRFSVGIERYLSSKTFRLFYLIDAGITFTDFKGLYSYNDIIDYTLLSDPFNITGITIFVQPGIGLKYKISEKLDINLESALWFGKGYDKDDNHDINPNLRFIPRPVSLFGLSYKFVKK